MIPWHDLGHWHAKLIVDTSVEPRGSGFAGDPRPLINWRGLVRATVTIVLIAIFLIGLMAVGAK